MDSDDKHLDGTGLGEVWAKIKSYVADGYLPLTGGTIYKSGETAPLTIKGGSNTTASFQHSEIAFKANSGTLLGYLGVHATDGAFYNDVTNRYKIWHAGNSNLSTVAWQASTLTAASTITAGTNITAGGDIYATGGVAAGGIADLAIYSS